MTRRCSMQTWIGGALGAVSALVLFFGTAQGSDRPRLTEEFHQVYPLTAQGRIELDNINGAVHISSWDRMEVKVDAVKTARSEERLKEAQIKIDSRADEISIRTQYPNHNHTFWNDDRHDDPASVEYTLTVPRQARLDEIKLINGSLDVVGVAGEVRASCINGRLEVRNLEGRARLNTINGVLDASVDRLPAAELELSSVNGSVRVTLPSDAKAYVEANTISGHISDDFGLPVTRHQFIGHSLRGELGGGGTRVKLDNVNGSIEVRHANDNRPLSPAKNLEGNRDSRDDDDDEI